MKAYKVYDFNNDYEAYFTLKGKALATAINRCVINAYLVDEVEEVNDSVIITYTRPNTGIDDLIIIDPIEIK